MRIITITIQERDGQKAVAFFASDGITPSEGETACRFVADQFVGQAIEAEVQRRLAKAQEQKEDES